MEPEEAKLSERQEQALAYIQGHKAAIGKMPTIRTISRHLGFSSSRTGTELKSPDQVANDLVN